MTKRLGACLLAFILVAAFCSAQLFAGNTFGSAKTGSGENLNIGITSPEDNTVVIVPPGEQTIEGFVNIGPSSSLSNEVNVIYVIDVSGSSISTQNNDVNQDGTVSPADDINGDGKEGTVLDAEVEGIIALNKSIGAVTNIKVGLVVFGNTATLADVSPARGQQDFTSPHADIDGNGVADIEEAIRGIIAGFSGPFRPVEVGEGTIFENALKLMNKAFQNLSGDASGICFFLSDGIDNNSFKAESAAVIAETVNLGVKVNTFAVGRNADSSQTGSLAGIANETGGSFTVVADPAKLSTSLPSVPVVGISKVEVNNEVVTISAVGAFSHDVSGLIEGENTVTAIATHDDGTTASATIDLVGVSQATANFSADPRKGMTPLTVNFTNRSGAGLDKFAWNFGDTSTSSDENPVHTYAKPGLYTVTLTAEGSAGSATEAKAEYIQVLERPALNADFDADVTSGIAPLAVKFTDKSQSDEEIASWAWNFGDGETSSDQNPSHTYAGAGKYAVTLTIEAGGDVDTITKTQFITAIRKQDPLIVDFGADPRAGLAPLTVNFFDTSVGETTKWAWDFGDNETSDEQAPSHVYKDKGNYTVKLTVTGPDGEDTIERVDYISVFEEQAPIADFIADKTAGFAPLDVSFTDMSIGNVDSWIWDFGDGSTKNFEQNPSHEYKQDGFFTVSLNVSGPVGSNDVVKTSFITILPEPPVVADFTAVPVSGFAPLKVNFTDASIGDAASWAWEFGDGASSSEQNPAHEYTKEGFFTVKLTASGKSGSDVKERVNFIHVRESAAPTANFAGDPRLGLVPLEVKFSDLSTGNPNSWLWDFGDGEKSSDRNPTHEYTKKGLFSVELTVTNDKGDDTERKINYINASDSLPKPVAEFEASPISGAAPLIVQFTDKSTPIGGLSGWIWDFGDGSLKSSEQNPNHIYQNEGVYGVKLTVNNPAGSSIEEKTNLIKVTSAADLVAPKAEFEGSPLTGLPPLKVKFTDKSTPTNGIAGWEWNFGDGEVISAEQNPTHEYKNPGIFNVSLKVNNAKGSSLEKKSAYVTVFDSAPPIADFIADPKTGRAPLEVKFRDTSLSANPLESWTWDFGDTSQSDEQHPTHTYKNEGFYNVMLTVSNADGVDDEKKINFIFVKNEDGPKADFEASPVTGVPPLKTQFTDKSKGKITRWLWSFGDGGSSEDENPSHFYEVPGVFSVTLAVSGPNGTDSLTRDNLVRVAATDSIEAQFSADPLTGAAPLTVSFTDNSAGDVSEWEWDFGDGSTSDEKNPENVYNEEGVYTVKLKAGNGADSDIEIKNNLIRVIPNVAGNFAASFSYAPSLGLSPLTVQFFDQTKGVDIEIDSREWDFGDGGTSGDERPVHTFKVRDGEESSRFDVSLTVTVDGKSDTFTVENAIKVFKSKEAPEPGPGPEPGDCEAFMQIKPETINTKRGRGNVKATIELSPSCGVPSNAIDCATLELEGAKALSCKSRRGKFTAKFKASHLNVAPGQGQVLTLTGQTVTGEQFQASDVVNIK